ncbi:MAG: hypothetical protein EZS28_025932, partial [Streblomastix strix]
MERSQINADLFADFSFADEHETEQSIDLGGMSISFGKTSDTHKDMNTEFQQDGPNMKECISLRFENENLRAEKCELQAKIDAINIDHQQSLSEAIRKCERDWRQKNRNEIEEENEKMKKELHSSFTIRMNKLKQGYEESMNQREQTMKQMKQ